MRTDDRLVRMIAEAIANWVAAHDGDEQDVEDWIGAAEDVVETIVFYSRVAARS